MATADRGADGGASSSLRHVGGGDRDCGAFPEEVWMLILARLPLPDLARARCVCRAWNWAWHNPGFRQLMHRRSLKVPWSVYFPMVQRNDILLGFDTSSGRQQRLPPVTFGPAERHDRVSGSRGFLCGCDYFWRMDPDCGQDSETLLVIANPLTKSRRELPPLRIALVGVVWFRVSNEEQQPAGSASFGVCVAGWTEEELEAAGGGTPSAKVYLSWRQERAWHAVKIPPDQSLCNFVVLNRKLFFVFRHETTHVEALAEYDPEREEWAADAVSPPEGFAWLDWVVECGGALYGIGAHTSHCFHLLRLDPGGATGTAGEWEVVRRLPDMRCDVHPDGCPLVAVRDAVVTQDGCLCIMLEHREPSRCKVLVYQNVLSEKDEITWHTLPSAAYDRDTALAVFGAYEPSFASFSDSLQGTLQ